MICSCSDLMPYQKKQIAQNLWGRKGYQQGCTRARIELDRCICIWDNSGHAIDHFLFIRDPSN